MARAVDRQLQGVAPSKPDGPGRSAEAISPDDDNELAFITRGLYVGTSGDVAVVLAAATDPVTFGALAAGVVHPLRVRKVLETGTSASGIVGVY
jgi:hypothetical protein